MIGLLLVLLPAQGLDERIAKLHEDCRNATVASIEAVTRLRSDRSVLPDYLELALPRVRDSAARAWVVEKLLRSRAATKRYAAIAAIGHWKHATATETLRQMLRTELGKGDRRDLTQILLLAQALADKPAFELLTKQSHPKLQVAAAYCLPEELHPASAGIFLSKRASVVMVACARASGEYALELDELVKGGVTRVHDAATTALKRLGKSSPKRSNKRKPDTVHLVLEVSEQMHRFVRTPNRMQVALREATKRLRSLDEHHRVNVFTYAARVQSWKRQAVVATPAAKRDAENWLDARARASGFSNLWEAMRYHREADEVFLFASGTASTGKWTQRAAFLIKFRQYNRFALTRVHTVAVTMGDPHTDDFRQFMKRLAEWTGGTHAVR